VLGAHRETGHRRNPSRDRSELAISATVSDE
jgi:hypothetical protein